MKAKKVNLSEGSHKLRLAEVSYMEDGRLHMKWEPMTPGFKSVSWTMAASKPGYHALLNTLGVHEPHPSPERLRSLVCIVIVGELKNGTPGFMNLVRVQQVKGYACPVFNSTNSVIEWKITTEESLPERGPDA